ncbi:MAG TPA: hypothetical protein ENJ46_06145 [Hellea balneolensis]|uniref:Uncharacterized protein n=1 Tax=Hellea balneolensis TaxID=287478 RepID=A0A7C3FYT1_9PROT|nr:hypothetical protein [Hellea balneolensis]
MTTSRPLLAFIAGSSFPALLIPFIVLGVAMMLRPEQNFPPQFLLWVMPVVMGLWNMGVVKLTPKLPGKGNASTYWIAGIVIGLLFTIVGVSTGAPGRLYGLTGNKAPIIMPIGMLAHGFIWGVMVRWTNKKLGLLDA